MSVTLLLKELFLSNKHAIELLTHASMGVPRTLGIILKESWNQALARGEEKISLDDLKYGIKTSGDGYYGSFYGNLGPSVILLTISADGSMPYRSFSWSWMSLVLIPRA